MPSLTLAVGAIAGAVRVCKSGDAVVAIAVAIPDAVAVEVQSKVCCGFELLEHTLYCCHMAGEWTGPVSAERSDYICYIWLRCKCCVHQRSDDRLIVLDTLLVKFVLPPIVGYVKFQIGVHGSCDSLCILHVKLLKNRGDESLLPKTNASAVFIAVDLDAEESRCWIEVHDLVFLRELCLDLDCCSGGRLRMRIYHGDVIDVQKDENAIAADIEVRMTL